MILSVHTSSLYLSVEKVALQTALVFGVVCYSNLIMFRLKNTTVVLKIFEFCYVVNKRHHVSS